MKRKWYSGDYLESSETINNQLDVLLAFSFELLHIWKTSNTHPPAVSPTPVFSHTCKKLRRCHLIPFILLPNRGSSISIPLSEALLSTPPPQNGGVSNVRALLKVIKAKLVVVVEQADVIIRRLQAGRCGYHWRGGHSSNYSAPADRRFSVAVLVFLVNRLLIVIAIDRGRNYGYSWRDKGKGSGCY